MFYLNTTGAFLHVMDTSHLIHIVCKHPNIVIQHPELLLGNLGDLDLNQLLKVAAGLDPSRPEVKAILQV